MNIKHEMIFYKEKGISMSGLRYAHLPYGPVPENFDILLGKMAADHVAHIEVIYDNGYEKHQIVPECNIPAGVLSDEELAKYLNDDAYLDEFPRSDAAILLTSLVGGEVKKTDASSLDFADADKIPQNALGYIAYAVKEGLMNGVEKDDGTIVFDAEAPLSRAQVCVLLYRIIEKLDISVEAGTVIKVNETSGIIDFDSSDGDEKSYIIPEEAKILVDGIEGSGQYVGTYMYWGMNNNGWWGEGEIKFYIDGDTDFPTICGTGTEDYFCGSYNFDVGNKYQEYCTPYAGVPRITHPDGLYNANLRFSLYRWHIVDPIYFKQNLRVTIQALGWRSEGRYLPRQDDISSVCYWYQDSICMNFPKLPTTNELEII